MKNLLMLVSPFSCVRIKENQEEEGGREVCTLQSVNLFFLFDQ
jgi:hypothetical protein